MTGTRKARPARTFAVALGLLSALAIFSYVSHHYGPRLEKRSDPFSAQAQQDLECRDIHKVADQCAFVHSNCEDEDAGIISYLGLYYCRLPDTKPVAFAIIALWACLLFVTIGIAASDFFSINLKSIAHLCHMSENLAGVTFLAFGNGSPDVFSTWSAMAHNSGSLAVGELIGAAGFITAIVPASMMLVKPFKVGSRTFLRDVFFFTIAVSFSLYFLANGRLEFWEAIVMVAFYGVYIVTVVFNHIHMNRVRARHAKEAAARSHYVLPASPDPTMASAYRDEEEQTSRLDKHSSTPRTISNDDFRDLELADRDFLEGNMKLEEADMQEARDRVLGEISSNMHVARPAGRRRTTTGPIRPSLIGALEFQAVLSSLRHQQNTPNIQLSAHHRSRSHNATISLNQAHKRYSSLSHSGFSSPTNSTYPPATADGNEGSSNNGTRRGARLRAVSANDAEGLRFDPGAMERRVWSEDDYVNRSRSPSHARSEGSSSRPSRPALSITPPALSDYGDEEPTIHGSTTTSSGMLAPPGFESPIIRSPSRSSSPARHTASPIQLSPEIFPQRPQLRISPPSDQRTPPVIVETDDGYLEPYRDDPSSEGEPLLLPAAHERTSTGSTFRKGRSSILSRCWPYSILPSPKEIFQTLFPSLKVWSHTSLFGKVVSIASVPSVFLLSISLPVVEFERATDLDKPVRRGTADSRTDSMSAPMPVDATGGSQGASTAQAAISVERQFQGPHLRDIQPGESAHPSNGVLESSTGPEKQNGWTRWLLVLQIFMAPLCVIFIMWADDDGAIDSALVPVLFSLLGSSIVTFILLLITSPDEPPSWHRFLCFAGFVVSIFWISTIAEEVVGVLKAIGVILNISDAILGLTIFAVGNSLGDLVADITVARLGYQVMAFSACFGGPLMNILIGIGISGAWLTYKGEEKYHRKHPDRPPRFKPYHIQVDVTLIISAIALLVTLLGYLIIVPLNKWKLDRKIAIGLIVVWTVGTIINLVVEVTGYGGKFNYHDH